MSLVSRSFEELLGQVAESAHRIKKSTGKYKLYQGDIVIVVRDVT